MVCSGRANRSTGAAGDGLLANVQMNEAGNPSVIKIERLPFISTDVHLRRVLGVLLLSIVLVRQSRLEFVKRVGVAEPGH